ncbi:MAG: aminopeptidase [Chloroflexi bacterium]|nr:aminopeptidase [Chloroflexota bacterium]
MSFEKNLEKYAGAIVKVGLNVQPGQRVLIGTPILNRPISFEHAPLVRHVARKCYEAGARMVSVMWGDPELDLIRLRHADPETISEFQHEWLINAAMPFAERGDAILVIYGADPDLYADEDPDLVSIMQDAAQRSTRDLRLNIVRNTNWCIVAAPTEAWAKKLGLSMDKFWDVIFSISRADRDDPIKAWDDQVEMLQSHATYMTQKAYQALHFVAPGTDLTVGLPDNHLWASALSPKPDGITNMVNLPTEEIFTTPHKDRVNGTVTASMPLSYGGTVIADFSLTFENGRAVSAKAGKGDKVLQKLLDSDEGSRFLGEVALVPHSSPISQSGVLFYKTLLDENAACHIALGSAYRNGIDGGSAMSEEEWASAGGNTSLIHVDFMIGSGKMDVFGVDASGNEEPVLKQGEWAFTVRARQ